MHLYSGDKHAGSEGEFLASRPLASRRQDSDQRRHRKHGAFFESTEDWEDWGPGVSVNYNFGYSTPPVCTANELRMIYIFKWLGKRNQKVNNFMMKSPPKWPVSLNRVLLYGHAHSLMTVCNSFYDRVG